MLAKVGFLAALPFILLFGVVITTDTVIVDVREGGPDGTRIVVPVPMVLARAAVQFVPEEKSTIRCPELWRYREPIRRVVNALRDAPDGELVRVKDRRETVLIRKKGSLLLVDVNERGSEVHLRFPLRAADRFLDRLEGEAFSAKDLLASFDNTMVGRVVTVRDGRDEVRITVW